MRIIIATIKSWNIARAKELQKTLSGKHEVQIVERKEDLQLQNIREFKPDYIFFPHWSYLIKEEIFEEFSCVVFHMTDLPYGRGGSPLQNLIERGHTKTKISAIQVTGELDAGPVYTKEELSLEGSAEEIFKRASAIIFEKMIPRFLEGQLTPLQQEGEITVFARRKPEQSELQPEMDLNKIFDYIRMLDAEGYPNAYLLFGDKKLTFTKAEQADGKVIARVEITSKQ